MTYSVADIWNQALGNIAVADEIQDPNAETSKEATACRRYYDVARQQVLRDFPWPRHTVTESLALVATAPTDQWGYAYRMPDRCAALRRVVIASSPRLDTEQTRIPFDLGRDATGDLVYTDETDASVEFTYDEDDPTRLQPDMVAAIAELLAAKIAPRFGPEAVKLGDRAFKMYIWRLATARQNALLETRPDLPDASSFERSRNA